MRGRRTRLVVGGVAAVAAASVVAAYASIPDSSQVIHGCYQPQSGQLRVIDTNRGQSCRNGERALNWNQQGPKGAVGPPGPPGPGKVLTGSRDTSFSSEFRPTLRVLHIPGLGTVSARSCEAHTAQQNDGGAVLGFNNETPSIVRVASGAGPTDPPSMGTGANLQPNHGAVTLLTFSNGSPPSGAQVSQMRSVASGQVATVTASVVVDDQGCHFVVQAISS